jgi:hypothetical protein
MNIVIAHSGSLKDCFIASSVNRGLRKEYKKSKIIWIVDTKSIKDIFVHNNCQVYTLGEIDKYKENCDLFINLYPGCEKFLMSIIKPKCAIGFGLSEELNKYHGVLCKSEKSKMNLFQIYFRLAGLVWRGESYDCYIIPKTKSKKNRIGLAISESKLKTYIKDNIKEEEFKLWHVPYKKDFLKYIDEINKCTKIVTDDVLTAHISIYLRKYVYFLETYQNNTKIEFFNNGEIFKVPRSVLNAI